MRYFLLYLLPLLLWTQPLKIATYNVENLFDAKYQGTEYEEYTPGKHNWNARTVEIKLNHVAEVICDLDADILGLQEIENSHIFKQLIAKLDNIGGTGTLTLEIMPGIPDRMFGKVDNTGNAETHKFLYLPVTNISTGKTWLNNNLGANYANVNSSVFDFAQQATAMNDHNAYGSLFQWGRKADGHELMNRINASDSVGVNGTTSTNSDDPSDALFITEDSDLYDWRVTQDDTLWASEASVNNVCNTNLWRVGRRESIMGE